MWQYVVFQEKINDLPEVRKLEMWNVPSDYLSPLKDQLMFHGRDENKLFQYQKKHFWIFSQGGAQPLSRVLNETAAMINELFLHNTVLF